MNVNDLSLKLKLGLGFGALLLVVLAMGVITFSSLHNLTELSAYADKKATGQLLAASIDSLINNQKAEYRAFLLTNQQEEMDRYAKNNLILAEDFDKLEATLTTDKGRETVAHFRQVLDQYHGILDRVIALHRAGKQKQAIALTTESKSDAVRADLGTTVIELVALQGKLRDSARQEHSAAESRTTILISGLTVLGVLLGLVVATVIARSIAGPIANMVAAIQDLSTNNLDIGDLKITSRDEMGKAGEALNRMKNNLRTTLQSIAGTASHVASASEEISSSATQQAQSAETQKDKTVQVATAMQEMSSTVTSVSDSCNKAATAASQAAETARLGGSIVDATLTKMKAIAESVGATAKKMEELGRSSDQIGRIIGVIDDIADQTNLLALNAAIEAARAGEQGRGFAVVADEVRKLAERTTTATKEIAQMIKSIQDETKVAVVAMESGTKQVEEGVTSTAKAGDSLRAIIQMSERVGGMIAEIATAATEQSSTTEQVNINIDQIAKLVKESAIGTQQSATACQDLSNLALDLQTMVSKFKLDGAAGVEARRAKGPAEITAVHPKAFAASAG
jgi:methyl-accepting chemotaxis protein